VNREIQQIGNATVIRVSGSLRSWEMLMEKDEFVRLLEQGYTRFIFNLEQLVHLGSASLGAILQCRKLALERDAAVRLVVSPRQMELLRITKLDEVFDSFVNEESALSGFGGDLDEPEV
jgi:anti-anti-sigma factor